MPILQINLDGYYYFKITVVKIPITFVNVLKKVIRHFHTINFVYNILIMYLKIFGLLLFFFKYVYTIIMRIDPWASPKCHTGLWAQRGMHLDLLTF